jgi:hypothetical protein
VGAAHSPPEPPVAEHATIVAEVALAHFNLRSDAIAHATTDKDMEVLKDVHTLVSNKVSRNEVRKWVHRWSGIVSCNCKIAMTPLFHV